MHNSCYKKAYRVSNLVIGLKSGIGPVSLFFPNHLKLQLNLSLHNETQTLTTFWDAKSLQIFKGSHLVYAW